MRSRETATTDDYDGRRQPLPIVNPYAVIALVAALLLLFPIAIVFGIIAFTYPRGRGMAWSALVLGCLQLGITMTVIVIGGNAMNDVSFSSRATSEQPTYATPLPTLTETTAPATTFSAEPEATTSNPPATTTVPARPANGSPCTESMKITTGADGHAMVCSGGGGAPRLVWQSTGKPLQPGIHDEGEPCDPSAATRFGQNSAGHVVQCLGPDRQPGQGTNGEWTTKVNAS